MTGPGDIEDAAAARLSERIVAYRALPPMGRADLIAYLKGDDSISDGVTHQIWDWTNGDLAQLIKDEFDAGYEFATGNRGFKNDRRALMSNGRHVYQTLEHGGTEYSPTTYWHSREIAEPDVRFNDISTINGSGRVDFTLTLHTKELAGLRESLRSDLDHRRTVREVASRERREQTAINIGCILFVVAVVIVVVMLIV